MFPKLAMYACIPSERRSCERARRPRNRASTRSGRATTHARDPAWGRPSASGAVVLPGGPLYLLGHEPLVAEACHHRAVGPPEYQDVRVEVRVVSGW